MRKVEEPVVMVLGKKRKLSDLRDQEDLLESMTDEEYQKWYSLERDFQREAEMR